MSLPGNDRVIVISLTFTLLLVSQCLFLWWLSIRKHNTRFKSLITLFLTHNKNRLEFHHTPNCNCCTLSWISVFYPFTGCDDVCIFSVRRVTVWVDPLWWYVISLVIGWESFLTVQVRHRYIRILQHRTQNSLRIFYYFSIWSKYFLFLKLISSSNILLILQKQLHAM